MPPPARTEPSGPTVAEDLHLDVAGARDEFFHVDLGTTERDADLGPAALEGRVQLIG